MMDKLWAPWRMEYIRSPDQKTDECVFCSKSNDNNDRENLVLYRGDHAFVLMNLYPYNNGHLLISPYVHEETTQSLSKESMDEIMSLADTTMNILRDTMKAQGFNFGANIGIAAGAGLADHIHFHIVPRWVGDTNFMPIVGHTKVMVDGLLETYDKLKLEFNKVNK